jgi:hypothetical protein
MHRTTLKCKTDLDSEVATLLRATTRVASGALTA